MSNPPPRKRQRRLVVLSSEDEDEDKAVPAQNEELDVKSGRLRKAKVSSATQNVQSSPLSAKALPTRSYAASPPKRRTRAPSAQSTTPGSSPEKKRSKKKPKVEEKTKSLHSFFQPATEEQRWSKRKVENGNKGQKPIPPPELGSIEEPEDDAIEDDSFDDEVLVSRKGSRRNGVSSTSQLRRRSSPVEDIKKSTAAKVTKRTGSGKRFLLPTGDAHEQRERDSDQSVTSTTKSLRPWAEEYGPVDLGELAVHKGKVADVRNWLEEVFSGRSRRRLLVLRGPAGSGKTTTVSLLSKELGYGVVEWKNSLGVDISPSGYTSMGAQFDDFLGRSDQFASLSLADDQAHAGSNGVPSQTSSNKRVILIEEFPTSLAQSSSGLKSFRTSLQRYLASAVPRAGLNGYFSKSDPAAGSPPIIIIVSETLLSSGSGALSDNLTVHRLLGPEISNHPGVSIIDFNKVAPTYLAKALDLVLKKEAGRSKRRRIPGPEVLKRFSEIGDIRSAISSLEFLCLRGDEEGDWSGTVAGRLKKSTKGGVPLTSMEKESLEMVTQREASLGIFHAVGKVMYNKRQDPTLAPEAWPRLPPPPDHLRYHARPKLSEVSIEDLINETGTDIQTFIAALHENYVLSCDDHSFTDCFDDCVSALSDADLLGPDTRRSVRAARGGLGAARGSYQGYGGSVDILRQEEISFQAAVRGLLFALPYPVNRKAPSGGRAGDEHKMFYPTSLRLWRDSEEIDGLLDIWMRRLANPTADSTSNLSERPQGVESWKKNTWVAGNVAYDNGETTSDAAASARAIFSRDEVLLERLPYLGLISKNSTETRDLEKIIHFRGVGDRSDDFPEEDPDMLGVPPVEPWATDRVSSSPRKHMPMARLQQSPSSSFGPRLAQPVEEAVDKLVLSDDDIEDD